MDEHINRFIRLKVLNFLMDADHLRVGGQPFRGQRVQVRIRLDRIDTSGTQAHQFLAEVSHSAAGIHTHGPGNDAAMRPQQSQIGARARPVVVNADERQQIVQRRKRCLRQDVENVHCFAPRFPESKDKEMPTADQKCAST